MPTIRVNKIASVVYRLNLSRSIEMTEEVIPASGNVVIARILSDKRIYNDLELFNGRLSKISRGNVIVGALGRRRALQGYVGEVPETLKTGDVLHLLNMGGVIGFSTAVHRDFGHPASLEVLGMAVRNGKILNLQSDVLPPAGELPAEAAPPIILVSGTCMNSGKTSACAQIIQELSKSGLQIHGGKLSGVACRRDAITMEDHGALRTATFLDAGYPSTAGLQPAEMTAIAKTIIFHLLDGRPDAVFLELGDGIIGEYGVMPILEDESIRRLVKAHIFCAGDMVGAWGGLKYLQQRGISVHVMTGPATDSPVGVEFIESHLGIPAINARLDPVKLGQKVMELLRSDGPAA